MTLATSIELRPLSSSRKMWSGLIASGALHVGVALFLAVGLPQIFQPDPPQMTVPVDIVNLDELSELSSLPAEQIGPVQSAEESKPVEEIDDVARPQQAAPQPAPAVRPTPPQPTEAPVPEPAVEPESAAVAPAPATDASEPAPAPEQTTAAEQSAVALPEPEPSRPVEATPQVSAVSPEPQTPQPTPEPTEAEAIETPPAESPEPATEEPVEATEQSEDQPLMAGVVPLPTPPRPEDAPRPEQQAEARPAQPTPPPSTVRAEEPPEQPTEDLLAGVLRNVDKNLKPAVEEQQQATQANAPVTQSIDLTRRAAALGQMIRGQMQRCWRIDPGARSAERLRVSVRVRLKPDGTLAAPPEFQNAGRLADNAYYRAAAESARRAIFECQPFRLPQEDYSLWQDMVLNFDPREMF